MLLDGELALAKTAAGALRMKCGDGTKKFTELPFLDEPLYTAIGELSDGGGDYLPVNTTATMPTGTTRYNCEGYLYATRLYGAVWNDYAEFRACDKAICPGVVVIPVGDADKVKQCNKHRAAGARVVTDTYGIAIGKASEQDVAVAVSGRVLVHAEDKAKLRVGDAVCAGKHGMIVRMQRWEIILYPDRVLGVVSCIPTETNWHGIPVSGRVWVELM